MNDKGVSIFYEYHEQGCPHIIAGIYSPYYKSEEQMREELLSLIGSTEFGERDQPDFVNHTHNLANKLLGNELSDEHQRLFNKFFPQGLEPEELPVSASKFYHIDEGVYKFIWFNRLDKELSGHMSAILHERSENYKAKRKEPK